MSFYKLGLKSEYVIALENQNITTPTPIQNLCIPHVLSGKDIIAQAQTGTGKTLAFLLPLFSMVDNASSSTQLLVITPTRELAIQISSVAKSIDMDNSLKILAAYGGQDVKSQLHKYRGEVQVVIGTPGRILDYIRRGDLKFEATKSIVIDEADQMFHVGFKKDIDEILSHLPKKKQILCFSATISQSVEEFSDEYQKEPKSIKAHSKQITVEGIEQYAVITSNRKKFDDFANIANKKEVKKAIIFCRSRIGTQTMYEEMSSAGYDVEAIHGAQTQAKRENVMKSFRNNNVKFLVATDLAARGLDITGVTHVFNYNLPDEPENYVHRIGRTGRAGASGVSYTFLTEKDAKRMKAIEDFINMRIPRIHASKPDNEPVRTMQQASKKTNSDKSKSSRYKRSENTAQTPYHEKEKSSGQKSNRNKRDSNDKGKTHQKENSKNKRRHVKHAK